MKNLKSRSVQIDGDIWNVLVGIAHQQNTGVGNIVNDKLKQTLSINISDQHRHAIDEVKKIRPQLKNINYKELTEDGRRR